MLLLLALAAVPDYVPEVLERWAPLDIEVTVRAQKCGHDNAFYDPEQDTVTLCTELFDRPELTRAILNHELAHAYFDQHEVPVQDAEFEADELGFMFSTEDENWAAAAWHVQLADHDHPRVMGQHPSHLDRAAMYLCLLDGFSDEPVERKCAVYARSVMAGWLRIVLK